MESEKFRLGIPAMPKSRTDSPDLPATSLCPHCLKSDKASLILIERYWCERCNCAFTPLESNQARIIERLREVIRELNKHKEVA